MHYVNLNFRFNQVFNQCINEQHAKYLPNIHKVYRSETNTYRNQRENTAADSVMRLALDIKVCATMI